MSSNEEIVAAWSKQPDLWMDDFQDFVQLTTTRQQLDDLVALGRQDENRKAWSVVAEIPHHAVHQGRALIFRDEVIAAIRKAGE